MPTFRSLDDDSLPTVSVAEAQERILNDTPLTSVERVGLLGLTGRVLREDLVATHDVPPFDNSAMDGYAVVAADTVAASAGSPVTLRVVGDAAAGRASEARTENGAAVRIMTGAKLPAGADAVVQVEWTDAAAHEVRIFRPVVARQNVRRRGEDVQAGAVVLRSGTRLRAGEVGMVATLSRDAVEVSKRPRVALFATGDELIEPGTRGSEAKIPNSNSYLLASLVAAAGADADVRGIVADSLAATTAALDAAGDADFVITSGGVSAGAFDYVKEALDALGYTTRFWRVAMKPGKPFLYAARAGQRVFALPGNPASAFVAFHLFAGPALRRACGEAGDVRPAVVTATAAEAFRVKADRPTYLRVRVSAGAGRLSARPAGLQGSHMTTSLLGVNGLAVFEGTGSVAAGEEIAVLLLDLPDA